MIECTYRKTKGGQWAIFGPADVVVPGAIVAVLKKDGVYVIEEIGTVGKPFDRDGATLVYGYPDPYLPARGEGYECDQCASWSRPARYRATDTAGTPGIVCGQCRRAGDLHFRRPTGRPATPQEGLA